ncbi:uncharacterized protein UTRI_03865_B [Ustilago trichophora]|uniref:Metallo-beta-lactamase domain-containing protein n=1 Tax=Ustilago trichophora TaxID=86804 RepID=A0A5C3DZF9_9BASI|nr:uncharacterized protein UTRI_03865_B [Ustilago trichophora]
MAAVELHKLNGDTSWLVRLPTSSDAAATACFYNLVLDPWLHPTPQVDGSPFFSRQTRIDSAAFPSLAQLDQWLRSQSSEGYIDAILFSHPFTDHLHPETLTDEDSLAVLQRATIFTTGDSLSALRSLRIKLDAERLVNLSSIAVKHDADQQGANLPNGISIEHLSAKDWALSPAWAKLHGGILISCNDSAQKVKVLYSPHGITPTSLPSDLHFKPDGEKRVLIHSFDRQTLPLIGTVACGIPNVLHLIPSFKPDIILATHDEHKRGEGVVGLLLSRQSFSLDHAQQLVRDTHPQSSCVLTQLSPGQHITIT